MSQSDPRTSTAEPSLSTGASPWDHGAVAVTTAWVFFQPRWLQDGHSNITKFPSPFPSPMHYLPPGTPSLNKSSSSQLSQVQDMLFMEKQRTPEKQKVRDYLAAVYRLLRKSRQSTAKLERSHHSFTYGRRVY